MANRNYSKRVQSIERELTLCSGRFALGAGTGAVGALTGKDFSVVKGGANAGEFTITLAAGSRFPVAASGLHCEANLAGATTDQDAKVKSYDAATGVIVVIVYVPSTGLALADAAFVASSLSFLLIAKNTGV